MHIVKESDEVARELLLGDKHHPRHAGNIQAEGPKLAVTQQRVYIRRGNFLFGQHVTGMCGVSVHFQVQQDDEHDDGGHATHNKIIRWREVKQQA
ncbi:hypothetical protein D3C86_1942650 [compost metagenome]